MMDDLISRQDAIEYFMTNTNWHDEEGYPIEDAEDKRALLTDYFNGIPSAQQEQRWIPCSERLPGKVIESYLVTVKWNKEELETTNDTEVTVAEWIDVRCYKGCENMENLDGWGCLNGSVIAWMPLPEPYTESEVDE